MDEFAVFIEIEIDAPGVTGVAVSMGTGSRPTNLELSPDEIWEDTDDMVFPSLAALKTAVNGTWTIEVTGADASTSSFTVNANGLVDGDFPPTATGLSPADGATGVSATTPLSWTPVPAQFQFVLDVFAGNDAGEQEVLSLFDEIPLSASSWQPPLALPTGSVEWGVFYVPDPMLTVDLVGDIKVTAGSITWLPHPLIELADLTGSWPMAKPLMVLASETIVQITVPEPDEVLQSGVALATLGLLVGLRSRKRSFADATWNELS